MDCAHGHVACPHGRLRADFLFARRVAARSRSLHRGQTKGDTSGLPLAAGLGYMENVAPANINNGLIKTPMKIDHQRSLLD